MQNVIISSKSQTDESIAAGIAANKARMLTQDTGEHHASFYCPPGQHPHGHFEIRKIETRPLFRKAWF